MRGHIHKRVRKNKRGKETTSWYVVVDVGVNADGRRQQKWHGAFRTRREAEVARAKIVNDLHGGAYVAPDRITLNQWSERPSALAPPRTLEVAPPRVG